MYVCMYLSMPVSFIPLVSKIHVHPEIYTLCVPVYWCAHVCDLQLHLTEQQGHEGQLELLVPAMKIINEDKYVNV